MHAAILSLLTGEPNTGELESVLGGDLPTIVVDGTQYLDGKTLYHGEAAAWIEEEKRVPVPTEDGFIKEQDEVSRRVDTEWYADLEEGWVGVSSSDGRFVHDWILAKEGMVAEDAMIRLDAWAERFEQNGGSVWGASYSQSIDDGDDEDRAGAQYHKDAAWHNLPPTGISALGFSYEWDGYPVRGMVAKSGYVAAYNLTQEDVFAAWISDEILPYLEYDTGDDQDVLGRSTCEECGREPERGLHSVDGRELCLVCADKASEDAGVNA
ncbi:hypothetical protein [Haloterrigena salifodinae]|uniref:hypothetical protein n=1 Tax=Haloterrigena salifodinae TaxID=2675099 RepID=UPI000F895C7B|nr:hypothetical protein [Haloterrigena salifodinae]